MTNGDQDLIEKALARLGEIDATIAPLESEGARLRSFVNQACVLAGREPMFPDETASSLQAPPPPSPSLIPNRPAGGAHQAPLQVRSDQFYRQPLATAVRNYLEARKAAGTGP